jgi:hypothetical protein
MKLVAESVGERMSIASAMCHGLIREDCFGRGCGSIGRPLDSILRIADELG